LGGKGNGGAIMDPPRETREGGASGVVGQENGPESWSIILLRRSVRNLSKEGSK